MNVAAMAVATPPLPQRLFGDPVNGSCGSIHTYPPVEMELALANTLAAMMATAAMARATKSAVTTTASVE
jgi:hypothetical protein